LALVILVGAFGQAGIVGSGVSVAGMLANNG
jgi:hypothetical protein